MNETHRAKCLNARSNICTGSQREAGQALLVVALTLVVLIVAAGFAVDMGYLRYEKRLIQTAADSAAIAGAAKVDYCAGSPGCKDMLAEGQLNSAYNGFTASPQTTVTINNPPLSGPHLSDANYVEAIVTHNVPTFFMKILGSSFSSFAVTARAVAFPGPGPACIYALNSMDDFLSGGSIATALQAPDCVIIDSGNLKIQANNTILDAMGTVYGGMYSSTVNVTPTPIKGAPVGDPLANLQTAPSVSLADSSCRPQYTYCQGLYTSSIPGLSALTTDVTFQPGVYVFEGGLKICCSGSVTGTGVTFYITSGTVSINDATGYSTCGDPTPALGSRVQLTAPITNPYAGVLLVQTSNQPQAKITLNNGDTCTTLGRDLMTSSYLWGALYFPTAQLQLNGTGLNNPACSTIPRFTLAVAYQFEPDEDVNFGVNDCATPPTTYPFSPPIPNPIRERAVLVE